MNRVLSLILAGGAGERLSILVSERAKPAVPFGGKYRIIDFVLSNCTNSGIRNVAVLTQFNPRSLAQHIGTGRPWDLDHSTGGVVLLQPYLSRTERDWYKGTADAIYQNLYFVDEQKADEVLILAGDHIYIMRYDYMISAHRARSADITVGVAEVPISEGFRFGIVTLDRSERIIGFQEKPKEPKSNLASMGIYVFNKNVLTSCLEKNAQKNAYDFGKDIIPASIGKHRIFGYRFNDYWRDVGTVESYWQANMDLIVDLPDLNLYGPDFDLRTVPRNLPPVKLGPRSHVSRSLLSEGCIVNGQVENSVLSPGVYVEEGAEIRDSIVFDETTIDRDVVINRSIIDKQVWIGNGAQVGFGDDMTPSQEEPQILNSGITVVGKGAKVPKGTKIGRNCKIGCWIEEDDYVSDFIASGSSVDKKIPRRHQV
ncbi:MAG: glucose-1-phosphate adenylyltransferase [Chloroflexota bacterium]